MSFMPIGVLALAAAPFLQSTTAAQQALAAQKASPRAVEFPAQVEAAEQTQVHARIAGIVQKVHVDIGDHVKKGQLLAQLFLPEVEAELRQKEALVAQAEAEVELARRALHVADAKLALSTAQVQEMESACKRAQAHYDRCKADYARLENLGQNKVIGKEVIELKRHELAAAQAGLAEAEAKVKAASAARDGSAAKRAMVQAEVKVALARQQVANADAQRAEAFWQFGKIRAPFDGLVAKRAAETGAFAGRGGGNKAEPLFVMVRTDSLRITVDIPEVAVPFLSTGMGVLVRFPVYKGKEVQAKVSRIAGALDARTRALRAEIDLPNPEGKVLPGMFAIVAIPAAGPVGKREKEAEPKETDRHGDLKALFQARLDAARKAYDEAVRSTQLAKRAQDLLIPLVRPGDVCFWSRRWLNAQRDMSAKKEDRIAALAGHLQRMKEMQQRVVEMNKNGLASSLEVTAVEFYRIEAELWLAREKAKFKP
jgi:multidrug resistance efflux pump